MKSGLRFASLISLAALLGCALTNTNPARPNTTPSTSEPGSNFAGNWVALIDGAYTGTYAPILGFGGALQASNGSITGSLIPIVFVSPAVIGPGPCGPAGVPTAVTGSVDANNNLIVTLPVDGGTATITASLTGNLQTLVPGSIQIVGGSCAMAATPMTIAQYAPVTGTYKGTLNFVIDPSQTISVTAVLTQSTAPGANDQFPLTGTITVTGACNASYTLTAGNGFVAGNFVNAPSVIGLNGPAIYGLNDPSAATISNTTFADVTPAYPLCNGPYGGTLIRQ